MDPSRLITNDSKPEGTAELAVAVSESTERDDERCFWIELRRACLTVARAIEVRYNLVDHK